MSADGEGCRLVMPFVACKSNGGEYEDRSFAAGVQMEAVSSLLKLTQPERHEVYVYPPLVTQLDLVAMQHGYSLSVEPWDEHPDDWMLATFVLSGQPEATA